VDPAHASTDTIIARFELFANGARTNICFLRKKSLNWLKTQKFMRLTQKYQARLTKLYQMVRGMEFSPSGAENP
jgi:hypothetical protein